jgi:hypothetical protein
VAAPVTPQPPLGGAALRGRVLVIDDEEGVGRVIQRILAGTYVVMTDTSAAAALARLRRDPGFDVVLCDLMMPEMTGMELHDHDARQAPPFRAGKDSAPGERGSMPHSPDSVRSRCCSMYWRTMAIGAPPQDAAK